MNQLNTPFPIFYNSNGSPLNNGYVYIGEENLNSELYPIPIFWDAAKTIPAANPLRTVNGFVVYNGTPAKVYMEGSYSILTKDVNKRIISFSKSSKLILDDVSENGTGWMLDTPQPAYAWINNNAGFILANDDSYALPIVGARRTSQMSGGGALGITGVVYNDNEDNKVQGWAGYFDAKSTADCKGTTWANEVEITNLGTYVDFYEVNDRKTIGITLGAGGGVAANGTTEDVTVGLTFTPNGSKFGIGISFGGSSLRTFTDFSGFPFYKAIALRSGMALCWEDATGNPLTNIRSAVTTTANEVGILITDNNLYVNGVDNSYIARFQHVASSVNYTYMYNAVSGGSPVYGVAGADTDIDIRLSPKGGGYIEFGGIAWNSSSDVPVTGYMTIKDNGGNIRKLATVA